MSALSNPSGIEESRPVQNAAFSYSGSELEAMAEAQNYYKWILRIAGSFVGTKVMEVGAGVGNFAAALLSEVPICELLLVEPAVNLHNRLEKRFESEARVKVVRGDLAGCSSFRGLDSLIAINTIEHIRDDAEFLRVAFSTLAPNGTVVLFAPAHQWLYGTLDESFEHYRRYSKSEMANLLSAAGFNVEKTLYINFPGILSWYLAGRVFRQKTLRPTQVRIYDNWLIPWISKVERHWEPPLGQSVLAVARKPNVA